jgi:hypothetical protein
MVAQQIHVGVIADMNARMAANMINVDATFTCMHTLALVLCCTGLGSAACEYSC